MVETVAFGVGGKALMRGVWELQMLEGVSLSACHSQQCADPCCDPRPVFPDPPCLGWKSLEAGNVSQAVPAWSVLGQPCLQGFPGALGYLWPVPVWNLCPSCTQESCTQNFYFHVSFAQQKCVWGDHDNITAVWEGPLLFSAELGFSPSEQQSVCQAGALDSLTCTKWVQKISTDMFWQSHSVKPEALPMSFLRSL